MKNKLMFIGLGLFGALNASEGMKALNAGQDLVAPSRYAQFTAYVSNAATSAKNAVAPYASKISTAAQTAGTTVVNAGQSVKTNLVKGWNAEIYGYKNGGKVALSTAAVLATVGLTYAAYKKGLFSKLNPFGKATVQAPVVEASVVEEVQAPVVLAKRTMNTPVRWNAKTRTYVIAQ